MFTSALILYAGLLIAQVATNPTLQEVSIQAYPSNYCDQTVFRNSLNGLPTGVQLSNIHSNNPSSSVETHLLSICERSQQNKLLNQILYDRVISNPALLEILTSARHGDNADVSNNIQNLESIPNIVNNYIILPPEYLVDTESIKKQDHNKLECIHNNPSTCVRVKKNASKKAINIPKNVSSNSFNEYAQSVVKNIQIVNRTQETIPASRRDKMFFGNTTNNNSVHRDNLRRALKRSLQEKNKSKRRNHALSNKNVDPKLLLVNDNLSNEASKKIIKNILEDDKRLQQEEKKKLSQDLHLYTNSLSKTNEKSNKKQYKNNSNKSVTSKKNRTLQKHGVPKFDDKPQELNMKNRNKKNYMDMDKFDKNKHERSNITHLDSSKHNVDHKNIYKSVLSDNPKSQNYQFYNMPDDSSNVYKFIDALLSNYQLTNTHFNNDFPLNYRNVYQFSQPSAPWENINISKNKGKLHKRRNQQRLHGRRPNRKRVHPKNRQAGTDISVASHNKVSADIKNLDSISSSITTKITPHEDSLRTLEENVNLSENLSTPKNMTSQEEPGTNFINTADDSLFNNNTFKEDSPYYDSHPLILLGMEDTVPIIFENGLIDDYYPDFTADHDVTHLTTEENFPGKYPSDKYHYVSNHNFNFINHMETKKRLAMEKHFNKNKYSNLFFSENDKNQDEMISKKQNEEDEEIDSLIQFQSPPLLDNPDFRTRKIDSNENYEPYYYHNVFQDPDEDFNKYYLSDKTLVYSTSMSPKNTEKSKLCNEIDDTLTAKWRKVKNANVETVFARSKLAKYGQTL